MQEADQILAGRVTFSTDAFFIQFTDNGQFVDLSGAAVIQPDFQENSFNHQRVSVFGHMGDRSLSGDPNGSPRVQSFLARKIVLQSDIALRAFEIFNLAHGESALADWTSAEREMLNADGALASAVGH